MNKKGGEQGGKHIFVEVVGCCYVMMCRKIYNKHLLLYSCIDDTKEYSTNAVSLASTRVDLSFQCYY